MNSSDIKKAKSFIETANSIAIVAHKSPDGDSVGSSLALFHPLKKLRKNVQVCMPDPYPGFLSWLEGASDILNFEENESEVSEILKKADLIFCLDFNSSSRVGKMEDVLLNSNARKIMIDHHQDPSSFTDLMFSFPNECSTSQLIYKFLLELGYEKNITVPSAEAMYCGIMTDTGSFKFPSTTSETHRIIASLIDLGVDNFKIHEAVFDQNTEEKLMLRAFILNNSLKIYKEYKTAILFVSMDDLKRFNYTKGDTEGLVNEALSLRTVNRAVFFTEDEGIIKISFRSKGIDNPVNVLASKYFHGGGHINASGGKYNGTMEDAIKKFVTVLPEFVL